MIASQRMAFVATLVVAALAGAIASAQTAFVVDIRDGAVAPGQRTLKVAQGAELRIAWSSDRALTIHLEGYDISVAVGPGAPATMAFRAHASGRFAVHAHHGEASSRPGGHAHGRALLRLEVHPK